MIKIKSQSIYNPHPLIKYKIPNNNNIILDYRNRIRIIYDNNMPIPQYFLNKLVFQSFNSFQQNNKYISKKIRNIVHNYITTKSINAIGGESYLYNNNINSIFYTNSESIINDYIYNGYNINNAYLINYNNIDTLKLNNVDTIINLSKLNINILKHINKSFSNRLIIIHCNNPSIKKLNNHKFICSDFWNKISYLTNYKLMKRIHITHYSIHKYYTVNIFIRKNIYSLGSNCAITYQLNKYNLRINSSPFDWSLLKLNCLLDILKNDFEDFLNIKINKFSQNHNNTFIISNKYMKFSHEVYNKYNINEFKNKLQKRIYHFKNDIINPIFIRIETFNYTNYNIYKKYWDDICIILNSIFHNNYKIILISKFNPKLDNIHWILYKDFTIDWKNNNLDWNKIFMS